MFWILLALIIIVFGMNLLHNTGTLDISGLRDTVNGWSPSLANVLFFAVEEEAAPEAALPDGADAAGETIDEPSAGGQADANAPEGDGSAQDGALSTGDDAQSGLAPVLPEA